MMTIVRAYVLTASGTERIPKQSSYALKRSEVQMRALAKTLVLLAWIVLIPTAALAQAVIAGTVRDSSGAVLPGVTVEAASPALIEKVRTAVTDGTGQYRVENLRPGTYSRHHVPDRFQRVQARRDRVDRFVHGDDQRRPQGRRGRGNDHRDRRNARGRRPERAPRGDDHERRPQVDPDGAQLQRHRQRRARRHDQPERRRHRRRRRRSFRFTADATTKAA